MIGAQEKEDAQARSTLLPNPRTRMNRAHK
jgi:hypothetical protein